MKILVKAIAGSRLFGTDTENSDTDFKGVYLPEYKEILLGTAKQSISKSTNKGDTKNNKDDVDCEYYSFAKFMKMLQEGQTVALELLFTPDEFIVESSPLWSEIVEMRDLFLHRGVTAFIGYARSQANKYGIKGSRMASIKKVIELLNDSKPIFDRLFYHWEDLLKLSETDDFINLIEIPVNKNMCNQLVPHLEVCSRKFDRFCRIEYVLEILNKIYNSYGDRSKQAESNSGIDWKAVSHALRVCYQGIELLTDHHITLPLPDDVSQYLLKVKNGELDFKSEVQPELEEKMRELEYAKKYSMLPEKLNNDDINDLIVDVYEGIVLDEVVARSDDDWLDKFAEYYDDTKEFLLHIFNR